MRIENLSNCTGCSACFSICKISAISMIENSEGFLYPFVDERKCVKCGLCERVCPNLNSIKREQETTKSFAVINNNEIIRMESSSGGVFTAISEIIIDNGGVVFGAKFASDFSVIHYWTDTIEGISEFRGSKYLQSSIGNSYKECKVFLEQKRVVLFSGTPCQIHGLKKFLGKEYENLITIDFICHGVPSPLLWKKYIKFRENNYESTIKKIFFRCKDYGWKKFALSITFNNNQKYCQDLNNDPYMKIFLKDIALRKSCYKCLYRGIERPCDLTIADFWGIKKVLSDMDDDKGTSLVITHSANGEKMLNLLKTKCQIKETNLYPSILQNHAILESPLYPLKRKFLFEDLNKKDLKEVMEVYSKTTFLERMKKKGRTYMRKIVRILKKYIKKTKC